MINRLTSITIPDSVITIGDYAFARNQLTSVNVLNETSIGKEAFGSTKVTLRQLEYNKESDFKVRVSDYGVIITGYTGRNKDLRIPPKIQGKPVVEISYRAFTGNFLTSVTIPDSVITIESEAFSINRLASVTIPDSVTTIGDYAFWSNNLTSVTIPNNVSSIGDEAFSKNKLTSVVIQNRATSIGSNAFAENGLFNFDLWSGLYTGMTKEQLLAKAREVFKVNEPNQEKTTSSMKDFNYDDNLKSRFPRNLTDVDMISSLSSLFQNTFDNRTYYSNVHLSFAGNRLFAISIPLNYSDTQYGTTSPRLLAEIKEQYGEPKEIRKEINGFRQTFYVCETSDKIIYAQGFLMLVINKQMLQ
jgi:hypothetical protein